MKLSERKKRLTQEGNSIIVICIVFTQFKNPLYIVVDFDKTRGFQDQCLKDQTKALVDLENAMTARNEIEKARNEIEQRKTDMSQELVEHTKACGREHNFCPFTLF